jgi:tetratricopeptide (TPR) repeat protein
LEQQEHFEKTPKKADRWFRAAIVFALLYGITFSLYSIFNWILFLAAAYSFFMSYYLLPVRPKIFQQRGNSFQRGERQQQYTGSQSADPAEKVKKIALIIFASVFGLVFLIMFIGIFAGNDPETQTEFESTGFEQGTSPTATDMIDIGNDFFNNAQYDSAEKYYDLALNLDGSNSAAMYGKGIALYNKGQTDEATPYFKRAYDGGYRDAWLAWILGDVADKKGESTRAITYYKECLSLDSGYTSVYERLAALDPSEADKYRKMEQKQAN